MASGVAQTYYGGGGAVYTQNSGYGLRQTVPVTITPTHASGSITPTNQHMSYTGQLQQSSMRPSQQSQPRIMQGALQTSVMQAPRTSEPRHRFPQEWVSFFEGKALPPYGDRFWGSGGR